MLSSFFTRWSLGLYLGNDVLQAVLLQWSVGRMLLRGSWAQERLSSDSLEGALEALLVIVIDDLHALKPLPQLVINLGLPQQCCAWQPVLDEDPVMWQRQAAMQWQVDPSQVYLDVLPIAPKMGLLVSTPCQPLETVFVHLQALQVLTHQPLEICLETDVSSLFKLWPWRMRQQLILAPWVAEQRGLFVDAAGLHSCSYNNLALREGCHIWCAQDAAEVPKNVYRWHWQVTGLSAVMLHAWHLAYLPTCVWHGAWPWVAWRCVTPLSGHQYYSLVTGWPVPNWINKRLTLA